MMNKAVTFAKLEKALLKAGFTYKPSTGDYKVYVHPSFDATIVLPSIGSRKTVSKAHLVAVRKTLTDKGVLEDWEFEKLLAS